MRGRRCRPRVCRALETSGFLVTTSHTYRARVPAVAWAIAKRNLLATVRMPSILAPTLIFPVFLLVSFTSGFTALTRLEGFPTTNFVSWYLPFVALQGASFGGAGSGFSAARDITNGFFDRLLLTPAHRIGILLGGLLIGWCRATTTAFIVLICGFGLGARMTVNSPLDAILGVGFVVVGACSVASMASLWSLGVAYRAKSERAAPLFFIVVFMALFLSTAQVPLSLMNSRWLRAIARRNPITSLLRFCRQGFVEGITWRNTWPGLLATGLVLAVLFLWAWTALARYEK